MYYIKYQVTDPKGIVFIYETREDLSEERCIYASDGTNHEKHWQPIIDEEFIDWGRDHQVDILTAEEVFLEIV